VTTDCNSYIQRDLGANCSRTNFGDSLGLIGLLLVIGSNTLCLELLSSSILSLVIRSKQIDLVVVIICSSWSRRGGLSGGLAGES
jgi:hypothetical protein